LARPITAQPVHRNIVAVGTVVLDLVVVGFVVHTVVPAGTGGYRMGTGYV